MKNNAMKKLRFFAPCVSSLMLLGFLSICACRDGETIPDPPRMEEPRAQIPYFHQVPPPPEKKPLRGLFVDANTKATSPDGKSWEQAFPTIMQAVNASTGQDIYVAAGNYKGTIDLGDKSKIRLIGGYKAGEKFEKENFSFKTDEMVVLDGDSNPAPLLSITGKANNIALVGGFLFKDVVGGSAVVIEGKDVKNPIKEISIVNCQFKDNNNNAAQGLGGGIRARFVANLRLDNLDGKNNKADYSGGLLYAEQIKNLMIRGGTWQESTAQLGGALYLSDVERLDLEDVRFEKNKAQSGGGAYVDGSKYGKIIDVSFIDNEGSQRGVGDGAGMLFVDSENNIMSGLNFVNNRHPVGNGRGGGLFLFDANNLTLQFDNRKLNKDNVANLGGVLFVDDSKNLKIENGIFNDSQGSGMRFENVTGLSITGTEINKATATPGDAGGGIYLDDPKGKVVLNGIKITECTGTYGAGLYVDGNHAKSVLIENSEFSKNEATQNGGALLVVNAGYPVAITNTLFLSNKANHFGGALALDARFPTARFIIGEGTRFLKNRSERDYGGGGMFIVFDEGNANNLHTSYGGLPPAEKRQLVFLNQQPDRKENSAGGELYGQFLRVGNETQGVLDTTALDQNPAPAPAKGNFFTLVPGLGGIPALRYFIGYSIDAADKTAKWNQIGLDWEGTQKEVYVW